MSKISHSKKTVIKGTLILTATGLLTKLLGFYNRIFLTRLIGVRELGIYQLIFPLYILSISFCCQGIATTITKQVSYARGKKQHALARRVLRYGLFLSVLVSLFVSLILYMFCGKIALNILKNGQCRELVRIAALAIPFVSIKACINAYYMGYEKPFYQGSCQLFEQIVRIASAYVLSVSYMSHCINAKMAMIAVVIGEVSALIYTLLLSLFAGKKLKSECLTALNAPAVSHTKKQTGKNRFGFFLSFLRDALPITTNNLMFNLFSSLEAIILPSFLFQFYKNADYALEQFGIITGIVIPFLLFPATVTTALSTSLLPNISYANANANQKAIKKALTGSALFCVGLGMCSALFYFLFGKTVCLMTFQNAQAGELLSKMAFLCPLIYLSSTLSAMMNGMDLAFYNLVFNIIGILIRILCTVCFVPVYGVPAYLLGMTLSYLASTVLILLKLAQGINASASCTSSCVWPCSRFPRERR